MSEHALTFLNDRRENLVGVFHQPEVPTRGAILLLHGWSGYRTGPHQMLTRAARTFGQDGFASLRFDFAGRGDSDGDTELATLATMRDDTLAAFQQLKQRSAGPYYLLGLCSGCEIAVASVSDDFAAAILWSAPIFAALPSEERQAKKRGENLKKYARKLLNPATYRKLLRGEIDKAAVSKAVAGGGGAASKNVESNTPGQLPPGFRESSLRRWKNFSGPVFQVYGGADPITAEARDWYASNSGSNPEVHLVAGANHSFYGLAWEKEVFAVTKQNLLKWSK